MSQRFYHVDAFTSAPFSGNPAVVCPLLTSADATWMQHVAAEMNVSETAFFHPGPDGFHLRWFTPTTEVDLCGHATLACAHVLWEAGTLKEGEPARFQTASGLLTVTSDGQWMHMDFPAERAEPCEPPPALLDGLGVAVRAVTINRLDYVAELESEDAVRTLAPDLSLLA